MVRLQQDIADYRAELKLSRTHTPAVSTRYWDSVQTTVEAPALTPEVPVMEKLLQRLVTDTQSRPLPVVNPPAPTELEQSMCPFRAGAVPRGMGTSTVLIPATTMKWTSGYSDWGRRHSAVPLRL